VGAGMELENKLYAHMHGDRPATAPPPDHVTPTPQQQSGQLHGFQPSTPTASPDYMYSSPAPPPYAVTQQPQQQQQQVTMATSHSIWLN